MSDQMTHPLAALIAGVKVKPLEWQLCAGQDGVHYHAFDPLYGREVEAPNEATCDAIDQDRTARILAALEAAPVPDLVEAGKVLEGVTPGPWYCAQPDHAHGWWIVSTDLEGCDCVDDSGDGGFSEANARFIAWCREGVPALIALATAQAAQIAGMIDADTVQKMLDSAQPIMAEACRGYEETIADLRTDVATLRAMQAEREAALQELRFHVDDAVKAWNAHEAAEATVASLQAQVERLRGALDQIAWSNDSKWQADCARAALEGKA